MKLCPNMFCLVKGKRKTGPVWITLCSRKRHACEGGSLQVGCQNIGRRYARDAGFVRCRQHMELAGVAAYLTGYGLYVIRYRHVDGLVRARPSWLEVLKPRGEGASVLSL